MRQRLFGSDRFAGVRRIVLAIVAFTLPGSMAFAAEGNRMLPPCLLNLGAAGPSASFDQFRGKVLYVDFWASWCAPCQLSFPFMTELQRAYGGRGLQVVAVDLDDRPQDAERFLGTHPPGFAVAAGPNGQCAKDIGLTTMPTSFLIDRDGAVRTIHAGFRPGDTDGLRAEVEQLLSESQQGRGAK